MDRILQNTPATISATWYEDGEITDPGAATIAITRADGTTLVAADTATSGSGTAARTYNLTETDTELLDTLAVTWTSPTKGIISTYAEIVGGFLFTLAQARALTSLADEDTYPTAMLAEYRTLAEQAFEDAAGVAFVPRYTRETTYHPSRVPALNLKPRVRTIRSLSSDATELTSTQLDELYTSPHGFVYPGTNSDFQNVVTVGYEHGYDTPPAAVSRAVLLLAKSWLVSNDSPIDMRATQFSTEDGPINLATPGMFGSTFGIPQVDQVLAQYSVRTYVA